MNELVWKSDCSLGHFQTDNEHKELVLLAIKEIPFPRTGEDSNSIRRGHHFFVFELA